MSAIDDVTQVILHERQARDQGWWDQMASYYHENSRVEVSWFKGSGAEFVEQSRTTARGDRPPGSHRISAPTVHVNGDRAFLEMGMTLETRVRIHGVTADLVAAVRGFYRLRRDESGWKIQTTHVVYGRDTLTPVLPGSTLAIDEKRLTLYREPYQFLAYYLTEYGLHPTNDLYGDDQPESIQQLYQDAFDWLEGSETGG
jgi:hypothetical protein